MRRRESQAGVHQCAGGGFCQLSRASIPEFGCRAYRLFLLKYNCVPAIAMKPRMRKYVVSGPVSTVFLSKDVPFLDVFVPVLDFEVPEEEPVPDLLPELPPRTVPPSEPLDPELPDEPELLELPELPELPEFPEFPSSSSWSDGGLLSPS